jgi:nitrite reductase/ring-hydroxylating ferredoxin subunit
VPYYNLPALHEEIKAYLPPPKTSMLDAYREVFAALRRQRRDPSYEIDRHWEPPVEGARLDPTVVLAPSPTAEGDGTHELGAATMLDPGDLAPIEIDGRAYVLCRTLDGSYAFLDGICTHGNARLADGFLDDCVLECPKHNGRFDVRTGAAIRVPATVAVQSYPLVEQDGRLVVDLRGPADDAGPAEPATAGGRA